MGHVLSRGESTHLEYLQQLHSHLLDPDADFLTKVMWLLETETEQFDMPYGFLTTIDPTAETQTFQVVHGDHERLQNGASSPLSHSYCKHTISHPDGLFHVDDAPSEGWTDDPAYEEFGFDTYIGATVDVEDDFYGTLCFASSTPRDEPVTDPERLVLDLFRRWATYELSVQNTRRALDQYNNQAQQLSELVSHDLRNPLAIARGQLTLMDESVQDAITRIDRAHTRIEQLIDDMLTLARIDDPVTAPEPIDLTECITHAWGVIESEDATLTVEFDTLRISAEWNRLSRVFENLFRNAIDHVGPGVTIRVGRLADGFYIEDDGPGIPESEQDLIFDAGYSKAPNGTGFGLSIVSQVVQAHDWSIRVTDGTDGGARFEITDVDILR